MILFFGVTLLILALPLCFPTLYVSELMLSFLPYLIGVSCLGLLGSLIFWTKRGSRYRSYLLGFFVFLFGFILFHYSKQFTDFYTPQSLSGEIQTGTLKVLFANIHKDNISYIDIKKIITDHDPDMLMFVEFADHHYKNLKEFLQKAYPYSNNTTWSKKFVGSMVFSKYPLTNKADDFPQGMRRYGYFSLEYQQQQLYFYLVHTSSPDTYNHFIMRNEQLKTFAKNFNDHEFDRKHDNIVVVGDFNITPWSSYYPLLSSAFSGKLANITQRLPSLFTREFIPLPFLHAHIDHLWTTPSLTVAHFDSLTFPGSDHKSFLFTLSLE